MTLPDAKKEFDAKSAVFVDTHSPDQFAKQHIAGAINIPANDTADKIDKLPKNKKIIVYCS
ncbi:MAG: rhodanese-like domain-containing protein [Pyrinomonadaceae bacterium]